MTARLQYIALGLAVGIIAGVLLHAASTVEQRLAADLARGAVGGGW